MPTVTLPILLDAALETRVLGAGFDLPADLPIFRLAEDPAGRAFLADIYREYLAVGRAAGLAMQLNTPTFRAHPDRVRELGSDLRRANVAAVELVRSVIAECASGGPAVEVAGVLGPRGDCYHASAGGDAAALAAYHRAQAAALVHAGCDLLYAATLPSLAEGLGLAWAMADVAPRYLVGWYVRADGRLPDGTPLADAIAAVDARARPLPLGHLLVCVGPTLADRLSAGLPGEVRRRLCGAKINGAEIPPDELEGAATPVTLEPVCFGALVAAAARREGWTRVGACCGTDARHLRELARQWLSPDRA